MLVKRFHRMKVINSLNHRLNLQPSFRHHDKKQNKTQRARLGAFQPRRYDISGYWP